MTHPNHRIRRARIRWKLARPQWRFVVQLGAAAAAAAAGFAFLRIGDTIDATAASVLVAVVVGVATVLQLRHAQRRQHTIELITNFQSNDALSQADTWMARHLAGDAGADLSDDDSTHLTAILDYYEFLSSLALRGLIEVPLLLDLRGGAMKRSFDACGDYIARRRDQVGAELYRSFELLVTEYARRGTTAGPPASLRPPAQRPTTATARHTPADDLTTPTPRYPADRASAIMGTC